MERKAEAGLSHSTQINSFHLQFLLLSLLFITTSVLFIGWMSDLRPQEATAQLLVVQPSNGNRWGFGPIKYHLTLFWRKKTSLKPNSFYISCSRFTKFIDTSDLNLSAHEISRCGEFSWNNDILLYLMGLVKWIKFCYGNAIEKQANTFIILTRTYCSLVT